MYSKEAVQSLVNDLNASKCEVIKLKAELEIQKRQMETLKEDNILLQQENDKLRERLRSQ